MADTELTLMLQNVSDGHASAVEKLLPLVYDELRALARSLMRSQNPSHTLQPTALVNEACVRMLGATQLSWQNRAHFFAVAATAMRQILASHARAKRAAKRQPGGERVTVSELIAGGPARESSIDLLALDDALTRLAAIDPRQSRLVELRFFGGLNIEEAAHVLGVSHTTVEREWRMVRAWLAAELDHGADA